MKKVVSRVVGLCLVSSMMSAQILDVSAAMVKDGHKENTGIRQGEIVRMSIEGGQRT